MQHKNRLTLFIPELFNQLKQEYPPHDLPNLALVLSKANVEKLPNCLNELSLLAELSDLSGFNAESRAALHLLGLDEKLNSWVCYASPVFIQPNRDHLSIVQANGFELDINEATDLCAEFNDYFQNDGLQFSFTEPNNWFCFSQDVKSSAAYSPSSILGKNIIEFLPTEITDVQWRKLFNETQMVLHHSATNQQRITSGKPEINSLWFWGGGTLAKTSRLKYNQVFTNNMEIKGLAKLGQSRVMNLPENISKELLEENFDYLIAIDPQYATDCYSLIDKYAQECTDLLKNKSINTMQVVPEYGQKFILTSKDLKKFWKRTQSISSFI